MLSADVTIKDASSNRLVNIDEPRRVSFLGCISAMVYGLPVLTKLWLDLAVTLVASSFMVAMSRLIWDRVRDKCGAYRVTTYSLLPVIWVRWAWVFFRKTKPASTAMLARAARSCCSFLSSFASFPERRRKAVRYNSMA